MDDLISGDIQSDLENSANVKLKNSLINDKIATMSRRRPPLRFGSRLAFRTRKRSLELRQFFSHPFVNFGSLVANAIAENIP